MGPLSTRKATVLTLPQMPRAPGVAGRGGEGGWDEGGSRWGVGMAGVEQRHSGNGVWGWQVRGQGGDSRTRLGLSVLWGHQPRGQVEIRATQIQQMEEIWDSLLWMVPG